MKDYNLQDRDMNPSESEDDFIFEDPKDSSSTPNLNPQGIKDPFKYTAWILAVIVVGLFGYYEIIQENRVKQSREVINELRLDKESLASQLKITQEQLYKCRESVDCEEELKKAYELVNQWKKIIKSELVNSKEEVKLEKMKSKELNKLYNTLEK